MLLRRKNPKKSNRKERIILKLENLSDFLEPVSVEILFPLFGRLSDEQSSLSS